jgi:Protein of unknown function (DUF3891)
LEEGGKVGASGSNVYYLHAGLNFPMVLHPILDDAPGTGEPVSAWDAVVHAQHLEADEYWLVPQPAHAALAGEIAEKLKPEFFGFIDATVARSIALHDAGWSSADAEVIAQLRAPATKKSRKRPLSFLDAAPAEAIRAWTGSIETAEKFSPIGGYIVSRHFVRVSAFPAGVGRGSFDSFVAQEERRQSRLLRKIKQSKEELEQLVDALQFCDLLSLYLCCGAKQSAIIHTGKTELKVVRGGAEYRLQPSIFEGTQQFSFPALRYPPSSRDRVGTASRAGSNGVKDSAVFYINL